MGHEVTIDVNNMTMSLKPRSSPHHPLIAGALRRLSTVAYLTCPSEFVVTNWKWYWKDNGNIWRMYDRDHMVRLLLLLPVIYFKYVEKCYLFYLYRC